MIIIKNEKNVIAKKHVQIEIQIYPNALHPVIKLPIASYRIPIT